MSMWWNYFVVNQEYYTIQLIVIIVLMLLYLFPTLIALSRNSTHSLPIYLFNLLLGWTVLGWVVALVWAVMPKPTHSTVTSFNSGAPPVS